MKIYTDGSCAPNPGPGGWAWLNATLNTQASGFEPDTSNNRMELRAILEAVAELETDKPVEIWTDSQLSINVLTRRWRARSNTDLITRIWAQPRWSLVRLQWVRGHNGHAHNEHADVLAANARVEGLKHWSAGDGRWI